VTDKPFVICHSGADKMEPNEFEKTVADELRLRGVAFDRGQLAAFVSSAWPWIAEDPCVSRWAAEFAAALPRETAAALQGDAVASAEVSG
jgi:hypothetical protein